MSFFERGERASRGLCVEHGESKADVNDHVVAGHGIRHGVQAHFAPDSSVVTDAKSDPVTFKGRDDEDWDSEAHKPSLKRGACRSTSFG